MNTSDWINYDEKQPKDGQKILLLLNRGGVSIVIYRAGDVLTQLWWQPWADPPEDVTPDS